MKQSLNLLQQTTQEEARVTVHKKNIINNSRRKCITLPVEEMNYKDRGPQSKCKKLQHHQVKMIWCELHPSLHSNINRKNR